jgi:TrmH family RNA methyltransferase
MITSIDNKKIKHIKKINSQTKYRKKEQRFVIENKQFILDVISNHSQSIEYIITTLEHKDIQEKAEKNNIQSYICDDVCTQYMSSVKEPMGCFAVVNQPTWDWNVSQSRFAIVLNNLKSPSNCGAIIRNAHAFGCDTIFLLDHCCDPYHPESIRASAGNILNIPIIDNPDREIFKSFNCWKCDINASVPLSQVTQKDKICFIFGSEVGFKNNQFQNVNACYIPMSSHVDSLNVAATSAIVLYHYSQNIK